MTAPTCAIYKAKESQYSLYNIIIHSCFVPPAYHSISGLSSFQKKAAKESQTHGADRCPSRLDAKQVAADAVKGCLELVMETHHLLRHNLLVHLQRPLLPRCCVESRKGGEWVNVGEGETHNKKKINK